MDCPLATAFSPRFLIGIPLARVRVSRDTRGPETACIPCARPHSRDAARLGPCFRAGNLLRRDHSASHCTRRSRRGSATRRSTSWRCSPPPRSWPPRPTQLPQPSARLRRQQQLQHLLLSSSSSSSSSPRPLPLRLCRPLTRRCWPPRYNRRGNSLKPAAHSLPLGETQSI